MTSALVILGCLWALAAAVVSLRDRWTVRRLDRELGEYAHLAYRQRGALLTFVAALAYIAMRIVLWFARLLWLAVLGLLEGLR